jgi:hypothetical protein
MFLQAPAAAAAVAVMLCSCHRLCMYHHLTAATAVVAQASRMEVLRLLISAWECWRAGIVVSCKLLLRTVSRKVSCKQAAEWLAALVCLHF